MRNIFKRIKILIVRRNFDTATMAARTLDVYEEVLFPATAAKRAALA